MRFPLLLIILLGLFPGCGDKQVTGVEVGNPELTVTARFNIEGNSDTAAITEMVLNCMGFAYQDTAKATGMVWNSPQGHLIDFADSANAIEMNNMKVKSWNWVKAEVMLNSPVGSQSLPDSISFESFSNPRFAKLRKKIGGETLNLLFEMPQNMALKVIYEKSILSTWHRNGRLNLEILIDGINWMTQISQVPPKVYRQDGQGVKYILLSPVENADTYNQLKSILPTCFKADSTEIR